MKSSARKILLKELEGRLKDSGISSLKQEFPFYKKLWEESRRMNPDALSSQDFVFFVYLREAEKIK